MGLVLPAGFFVGLFVVVNRLNMSSEIDAMLASGLSLGRIATPLVGLGVVLMIFSLLLYGFVQPYSRYGYHAVLHAAQSAGWNGEIRPRALLSPSPDLVLTADDADATGQKLQRVFIRRVAPDGREDVLTAASAGVHRTSDGRNLTLALKNGQLLSTPPQGTPRILTFNLLTVRLPLVPAAKLLRARGAQESELTLIELAEQGFGPGPPVLPRQTLLAELYSRLARAIALPLMPLLALPFGLTAKRAGSGPAMGVGGILLFAFQTSMVFAQGLAADGRLTAALAIGGPMAIFAAACIATWVASRRRPGENPVNWIAEHISDVIALVIRPARRAGSEAGGETSPA
jgi:lipopolysaccharide export system permease protein